MKYLILLTLFLSACGGDGFKTIKNIAGEGGNSCKPARAITSNSIWLQNEYQKQGKKVILTKKNKIQNNILDAGTELSVLIDRYCLESKKINELSHLTKHLKKILPIRKNKNLSREEAYTVKLPVSITLNELETLASLDDCIKGVTEETYVKPQSVPNDTLLSQQTHMAAIKYHDIYDPVFNSAKKITGEYLVAVIDTGQLLTHEDMAGQLWKNKNEIPNNSVDDDGNGIVDDYDGANFSNETATNIENGGVYSYHGTHVAGFIGSATNNNLGTSSIMGGNTKILPIALWPSVIGGGDYAPISVVDRGLRYAVDHGAQIINISMRGDDLNPNMQAALVYAVNKGATVLVAAANDSKEINPNTYHPIPAFYAKDISGVLAVAATDSKNNGIGERCSFSSWSTAYVEIAAPGCDTSAPKSGLLSLASTSAEPTPYGWIAGTSMASPVAAGAAAFVYALLKEQANIQPTPALIEEVIKKGSIVNPNLFGLTMDAKQIDLKSIYEYIQRTYVTPVPPDEEEPCP